MTEDDFDLSDVCPDRVPLLVHAMAPVPLYRIAPRRQDALGSLIEERRAMTPKQRWDEHARLLTFVEELRADAERSANAAESY